jgi:hypothetical protein
VHPCDVGRVLDFCSTRRSVYVSIRQHTSAYVRLLPLMCIRVMSGVFLTSAGRAEVYTSAYVSIRQHTSAYVSIRQHPSSQHMRQHTSANVTCRPRNQAVAADIEHVLHASDPQRLEEREKPAASTRQHTSAYVSIRQYTSAYVSSSPQRLEEREKPAASTRQHTSAYVSIRQHTSVHVSIRQQQPTTP